MCRSKNKCRGTFGVWIDVDTVLYIFSIFGRKYSLKKQFSLQQKVHSMERKRKSSKLGKRKDVHKIGSKRKLKEEVNRKGT